MAKKDDCDCESSLIFRQCRYCLVFLLSTEAVSRHNADQCHFDNTDSRFIEQNRTRSLRFPRAKLSLERVNINIAKKKLESNPSIPPPASPPRSRRRCRVKAEEKLRDLWRSQSPQPDNSISDEEKEEKINSKSKGNSENKCPFKKCGQESKNSKKIFAKCRICGKSVSLYFLKKHEENHKKHEVKWQKKKHHCPLCGIGVKDRWTLRRHFIIHLENNPFVCKFSGCGARCGNNYSFQKHIKLHFDEYMGTREACKTCGVSYRSNPGRSINHKCKTDPNKIVVGKDGRKYLKRSNLRVKRVEVENIDMPGPGSLVKAEGAAHHHDDDRMELESVHFVDNIVETDDGPIHLNGEELQSSSSVKVENGHEDADEDGKFSNREIIALIQNDPVYKTLIKERPEVEAQMMGMDFDGTRCSARFPCSKCSAVFTRYCFLTWHEKVCSKERQPVKTESNNEIQLMCMRCGFQAFSGEDMEHHQKTAPNHGYLASRNHKCVHFACGILFATEEKLQAHIQRIHLQEKPFKCDICQTTLASKFSLEKHTQRKHSFVSKATGVKNSKLSPVKEEKEKNPEGKLDAEAEVTLYQRQEHQQQVKPTPRMKCEICGDTLAGRHSLQRHIRGVHARTLKKQISSKSKAKEGPPLNSRNAGNHDFSSLVSNTINHETDETEQCILRF